MPKLADLNSMEQYTSGHYGFSGVRIENLGATEYTLVSIAVDCSGSVSGFQAEMEKAVQSIVESCYKSPRADNLMIRLTTFNSQLSENHGFKLLSDCNKDDYKGALNAWGSTALFDASENAVSSVTLYGKSLMKNDFNVNAIIVVVTDGCDNVSKYTANSVKESLKKAVSDETLESLVSILIGVNIQDTEVSRALDFFHKEAGFTQYVEVGNADSKTLAKLADFVSKSISSQSQSLGTGGPSKPLTF